MDLCDAVFGVLRRVQFLSYLQCLLSQFLQEESVVAETARIHRLRQLHIPVQFALIQRVRGEHRDIHVRHVRAAAGAQPHTGCLHNVAQEVPEVLPDGAVFAGGALIGGGGHDMAAHLRPQGPRQPGPQSPVQYVGGQLPLALQRYYAALIYNHRVCLEVRRLLHCHLRSRDRRDPQYPA